VIAIVKAELREWLDESNAVAIAAAQKTVKDLKNELIIGAAKNVGVARGSESRKTERPYFSPGKPEVSS